MSLFRKKESAKTCPLCGGELKLFSSQVLADGNTICENCVNQVRNHYSMYYRERLLSDNFKLDDEIRRATLAEITEIMQENKAADDAAAEQAGDYSDLFVVEFSLPI